MCNTKVVIQGKIELHMEPGELQVAWPDDIGGSSMKVELDELGHTVQVYLYPASLHKRGDGEGPERLERGPAGENHARERQLADGVEQQSQSSS